MPKPTFPNVRKEMYATVKNLFQNSQKQWRWDSLLGRMEEAKTYKFSNVKEKKTL